MVDPFAEKRRQKQVMPDGTCVNTVKRKKIITGPNYQPMKADITYAYAATNGFKGDINRARAARKHFTSKMMEANTIMKKGNGTVAGFA